MWFVVATTLYHVVDEERSNSDLGTDVGKLGPKRKEHVILLPNRTLADWIAGLIDSHNLNISVFSKSLFRHFWKPSEDVENSDSNTETCNSEVDKLLCAKLAWAFDTHFRSWGAAELPRHVSRARLRLGSCNVVKLRAE